MRDNSLENAYCKNAEEACPVYAAMNHFSVPGVQIEQHNTEKCYETPTNASSKFSADLWKAGET